MTTMQIRDKAKAAAESNNPEEMRKLLIRIAEQMQENLDKSNKRVKESKKREFHIKPGAKLDFKQNPVKEAAISNGNDDKSFAANAKSVFSDLQHEYSTIATDILSGGKNW